MIIIIQSGTTQEFTADNLNTNSSKKICYIIQTKTPSNAPLQKFEKSEAIILPVNFKKCLIPGNRIEKKTKKTQCA